MAFPTLSRVLSFKSRVSLTSTFPDPVVWRTIPSSPSMVNAPAAVDHVAAAADVSVKAPELVDQVAAPADVIVMGLPARVAPVVPS